MRIFCGARRVEVDLDDVRTHAARLVINTQRRIASDDDYNEFAEYLHKTEPGDEEYTVKSGQTIVERICELTGIPERTVRFHLDARYKQSGHEKLATVANPSERVEVDGLPTVGTAYLFQVHSLSGLRLRVDNETPANRTPSKRTAQYAPNSGIGVAVVAK